MCVFVCPQAFLDDVCSRLTIGLVERSKHFRLCPAHFALRNPDTFKGRVLRRISKGLKSRLFATLVEFFDVVLLVVILVGEVTSAGTVAPPRPASRRAVESKALFTSSEHAFLGGRYKSHVCTDA